ncbi:MAG: methanethiol S-methyltransferase [Thermomicrobiales bacterium]
MGRITALVYGGIAYVIFLFAFLYAIGFVENAVVPKTIDSGAAGGVVAALIVNALLLGLFAIQHSVMARPAFKRRWTRIVPQPVERSTYVLLSSLILLLIFWQWRPMLGVVWRSDAGVLRALLYALSMVGWLIVLLSTFMINHFDLFGLRQVYTYARQTPDAPLTFTTRWLYTFVRHPIMLGFIIAFWAAPTMTAGHLLFAIMTTGYILVALQFEEHDLRSAFGQTYAAYQQDVRMLVPLPKGAHHGDGEPSAKPTMG